MNQHTLLKIREERIPSLPILMEPDVVFLILARNEADILGETLLDLGTFLTGNEAVHVVADHCSDETALIARQNNVHVWDRSSGQATGKGAALGWWLRQTADQPPDQIIVVLDADSRLAPDFTTGLREAFQPGVQVLQSIILPSLVRKTPGSLVSAISELSEQFVDDRIRAGLGWPVRLRGTGMAFRREVLETYAQDLHTLVEDVELSINIAASGLNIESAPGLVVYDPKPISDRGVINQRARWLRGQFQIWGKYGMQIWKIVKQGPPGISLLISLLLKPKTLVWAASAVLSLLLLGMGKLTGLLLGGRVALGLTMLYALLEGAKIVYTFNRIPDRRHIWKALPSVPVFALFWLFSLVRAVLSGNTWLRSRPEMDPNRIG